MSSPARRPARGRAGRRPATREESQGSRGLRAGVLVPLAAVAAVLLLAALGPLAAPYPPDAIAGRPLLGPSGAHPLGTNTLGQDLYSQLLSGARPAVLAGALGGAVSTALAVAVGLAAASRGPRGALARSATDLVLAVPHLPLLILVIALAGPSLSNVAIALGMLSWPAFARVLRATARTELAAGHALAARAIGASESRILVRHVAPALLPIAGAKLLLTVQYVVLAEASLAFLGLGDPSLASWGGTAQRAMGYALIFVTPAWSWWLAPPVLAIGIFVASLALLGTLLDEHATPALRPR